MYKYKTCSGCNRKLQRTFEFFYHSKYTSDGLATKCKLCTNKLTKKYNESNREKHEVYTRKLVDKYKKENSNKVFDSSHTLICNSCGKEYPMTEEYFYRNNTQKRGLRQPCKECCYDRRFRKRTLYKYRMSNDEYIKIYNNQNGKCAICRKTENAIRKGRKVPLSVDHSHDTGIIRGLLCTNCNIGLGMFNDDVKLMKGAIKYLSKHNGDS